MVDLEKHEAITLLYGKTFEEAIDFLERFMDLSYGRIKKEEESGFVKVSCGGWSENEWLMGDFTMVLSDYVVGSIQGEWILHPEAWDKEWEVVEVKE